MKKIIQLILICLISSSYTMAQNTKKVEIQELNTKTFKEKVWNFDKNKKFLREGKTPIILDFSATWCPPCKLLKPHLRSLQAKFKGKIYIYEIDVDKEPELAQRFNVTAMPTLIFIGSSTSYKTELGYQEYDALEKVMKNHFLIN
jgi:thioredoxin 1